MTSEWIHYFLALTDFLFWHYMAVLVVWNLVRTEGTAEPDLTWDACLHPGGSNAA